jgi:outer membrane protein assembly factor BamB
VRIRLAILALVAGLAGAIAAAAPVAEPGAAAPAAQGADAHKTDAPPAVSGTDAPKPPAAFTLRWRRNIGDVGYSVDQSVNPIVHPGQVRWRMKRDYGDMGNSILQPVMLNGGLFVANSKGKILRLNPATGEQLWRIDTGITITGGVGAGSGLILVGGEKGEVRAYDETGKLRWQTLVSSEVLGPPLVAGGLVVVRSGDGRIAGLNIVDGKRKWLYEHAMPALVVRASAGVSERGGTIFAGFAGGKLAAIDLASGNLKWESTLSEPHGSTELERISDITSLAMADDEMVCAVSFQGRVGCFDTAHGGLLWSRELSSDKGLELAGKFIYIASADGEILAMDKSNGSSAWKNAQLAGKRTAAPHAMGDYLIAGDRAGIVYAIRRGDGSIAAHISTDGSAILAPPVEVEGGLLVQTYNGGLYSVMLH